jgi:hypothetical protein
MAKITIEQTQRMTPKELSAYEALMLENLERPVHYTDLQWEVYIDNLAIQEEAIMASKREEWTALN